MVLSEITSLWHDAYTETITNAMYMPTKINSQQLQNNAKKHAAEII